MTNKYEAKLDSKKRITIRSPRTDYYHVIEKNDGTVVLSPRVLLHPDEISKRTLKVIEKSMENFKKGIVSDPVDFEELDELLKD